MYLRNEDTDDGGSQFRSGAARRHKGGSSDVGLHVEHCNTSGRPGSSKTFSGTIYIVNYTVLNKFHVHVLL